jgi:ABC-type transporter MlaC component
MKTALLVFVLCSASAFCQDPGAMAAQQAMQQAIQINQQATQQAMQDMQQASQHAQQAMQQAIQANLQTTQQMMQSTADTSSSYSRPYFGVPNQPSLSVKSGNVMPGTKVHIKWRYADDYAAVYYTTDGWTPTTSSALYEGPIPIDNTTQLQAIAVSPCMTRSLVAHAEYTMLGPPSPTPPLALSADGVLHAGTRLRLITGSTVNSKTAHVGDKLSILLDQDVKAGDVVVLPKGTPFSVVLTIARPAARHNVPGNLAFDIYSINARGKSIRVSGGETLQGEAGRKPKEAVIEPGMNFTVAVAVDTPLLPSVLVPASKP